MKKVKNSADLHQKQGLEQSKKLYRTTSEQAKRLDDARSCARTISDLFTPNLHIQRRKFCEYCERLIFSDPLLYGKKGEELLWRKGYYDVISSAKRLKKKEYSQNDIISIQNHINSGVGFYHHLITKLQTEFGLKLNNVIDFTIENSSRTAENVKPEHLEWAMQAAHQCLIYLGDLNRYKLEIHSDEEPTLSFRYYLQAISYKSDHGMPHNQMGTLAMNQDRYLDAVYHYMRCLSCSVSFEGTTNNLHSLFEKNSMFIEQLPQNNNEDSVDNQNLTEKTDHLKHFIARFLLLIDIWYFNKKVSKVYNLCHQTCKDLEQCLMSPKGNSECASPVELESTETSSSSSTSSTTPQLTNDMIFKIVVICLLCVTKLQKSNSQQVSTVVAFTLAIYSQLVQNVTSHIQDQVLNYPLPPEAPEIIPSNGIVKALLDRGKKKQKLRRRKAIEIDSEASEDEQDDSLSDSSDDSFISECDALAHSSEDDDDDDERTKSNDKDNVKNIEEEFNEDKIVKRVKRMDVDDMLEIIMEEGSLHSIKIINDWLMLDTDILKSCGSSTRSLLKQITDMLNLINIDIKHKLNGVDLDVDNVVKNERKVPISEDVVLKGVEILAKSHKSIDWNYMKKRGVNAKEETVIRIVKLMTFGKFLTSIDETGISFDETKNEFVCKAEEPEKPKTPPSVTIIEDFESQNSENGPPSTKAANNKDLESKGQLLKMKHMGQLWLASEVRALENRVRGGKTSLSPYLVLDADALIKYTFMIKHLVHSRKFIVLVPSAVVSALDDLKREQSEARDAIRWLESQFHRGNRFFRSQRPHEKAPIPFIKYPKKKDKEMTTYIQIIECCHYLAEQQKDASNLVTLLIGNQNVLSNGENKEFSYVGLAKSAGVSIESITQFYGKWKKNYKGKR